MAKIVVPTANTVITSAWGKSVADALNAMFVQVGANTATTNASGDTTITYPTPMSAPAWVPILQNNTAGTSLMFSIISSTVNGFTFRSFIGTTGAAYANQSVAVYWLAAGVRP